jgi:hypothetical protein
LEWAGKETPYVQKKRRTGIADSGICANTFLTGLEPRQAGLTAWRITEQPLFGEEEL